MNQERFESEQNRNAAESDQTAAKGNAVDVQDLVPAYSIGATDPEESALVAANLTSCPNLAEYQAMAESLLYSAPPRTAPVHLADRLRAAIAQPADTPAVSDSPETPIDAAAGPARSSGRPASGGLSWGHLLHALSDLWRQPSYGLAAVMVVLLVLTNVYWSAQVRDLRRQQASLSATVSDQQDVLALLGGSDAQSYVMTNQSDPNSPAKAKVLWESGHNVALLYAEDFPPLAPGQAYQLWLLQGDKRTSGGLFKVNKEGYGVLIVRIDKPLDSFSGMGITPEPDTGSPGPTAPPVVRVKL